MALADRPLVEIGECRRDGVGRFERREVPGVGDLDYLGTERGGHGRGIAVGHQRVLRTAQDQRGHVLGER